jgi:hypothetical protein
VHGADGRRKMQIKIDKDEWYPVYDLAEFGQKVDIEEETYKRWKKAFDEFDSVQAEMRKLYEAENDPS